MPKYSRYQDYVIRDGRLIGEFEQLYRDFKDPWLEASSEQFASDKAAAINLLCRLREHHGIRNVIELGCGFGHFSAKMAASDLSVVGIDISETAIGIARQRHQCPEFRVGTIDDHDLLRKIKPDVIVMAEVTWYVLEQLPGFKKFIREEMPKCFLLHLLTTYPPGVQTYGTEYFTDLTGIKDFFAMRYLESGEVHVNGGTRTWFLGTWDGRVEREWHAAFESQSPAP
jgi:SAM-dependent methyltransferase